MCVCVNECVHVCMSVCVCVCEQMEGASAFICISKNGRTH